MEDFARVRLLVFDIDGTLTDATTMWLGPEHGWTQTYSVRDGEALLRLRRAGVPSVPLSRNATKAAKARMELLGMDCTWMAPGDKLPRLAEICAAFAVTPEAICYVGDGAEDVPVLERVGLPCSVADGHPAARAASKFVTEARGGARAVEELVDAILAARSGA